jgi:hypothetical protein
VSPFSPYKNFHHRHLKNEMRATFLLSLGSLLLSTLVPTTMSTPEEMESLRSHSLYIPYIDEELRMRYWGILIGGD